MSGLFQGMWFAQDRFVKLLIVPHVGEWVGIGASYLVPVRKCSYRHTHTHTHTPRVLSVAFLVSPGRYGSRRNFASVW